MTGGSPAPGPIDRALAELARRAPIDHPGDAALIDFVWAVDDAEQRRLVVAHLAACDECVERIAGFERDRVAAEGGSSPGEDAPIRWLRSWRTVTLATAAAAAIVLLVSGWFTGRGTTDDAIIARARALREMLDGPARLSTPRSPAIPLLPAGVLPVARSVTMLWRSAGEEWLLFRPTSHPSSGPRQWLLPLEEGYREPWAPERAEVEAAASAVDHRQRRIVLFDLGAGADNPRLLVEAESVGDWPLPGVAVAWRTEVVLPPPLDRAELDGLRFEWCVVGVEEANAGGADFRSARFGAAAPPPPGTSNATLVDTVTDRIAADDYLGAWSALRDPSPSQREIGLTPWPASSTIYPARQFGAALLLKSLGDPGAARELLDQLLAGRR